LIFTFLLACACLWKLLQSSWIITGFEGIPRGLPRFSPKSEGDFSAQFNPDSKGGLAELL
jgi:hypothetical protein